MNKKKFNLFLLVSFILLICSSAKAEVDAEVAYIFNTFSFSGVPYLGWFCHLQTYGTPEKEIWPHIIAQEA